MKTYKFNVERKVEVWIKEKWMAKGKNEEEAFNAVISNIESAVYPEDGSVICVTRDPMIDTERTMLPIENGGPTIEVNDHNHSLVWDNKKKEYKSNPWELKEE